MFAAASKLSVDTVRKHTRVSVALEHPTWLTTASYVPCSSTMEPVGTADPEFMIPARKRPSLSPPFAKSWLKTDAEPALSPQL